MLKASDSLLRRSVCTDMINSKGKSPPDIAQLVEHLTVDLRSDQMVPGSIPGVRIWVLSSGEAWPQPGRLSIAVSAKQHAETRDRTGDLQIFSLTLSQLSYRGLIELAPFFITLPVGTIARDSRNMHQPGIEPGSHQWQRCILPLDH